MYGKSIPTWCCHEYEKLDYNVIHNQTQVKEKICNQKVERKNSIFFLFMWVKVHKCLRLKRLLKNCWNWTNHYTSVSVTMLAWKYISSVSSITFLFVHLKSQIKCESLQIHSYKCQWYLEHLQWKRKEFLFERVQNLLMTFMLWSWVHSINLIVIVFHSS